MKELEFRKKQNRLVQLNTGWEENESKFIQVVSAFIPLVEVALGLATSDLLYSIRMQLRTIIKSTEDRFSSHEKHKQLVDLLLIVTNKEEQLK
jgi:hypothetical protein